MHCLITMPCHAYFFTVGPNDVRMSGPSIAETGDTVMFNCSARSWPASHFSWYFTNGSIEMVELMSNGSSYTTNPLTLESSGNYTCMAKNNVTGLNSSASVELLVLGENVFWNSEDWVMFQQVFLYLHVNVVLVPLERHRFDQSAQLFKILYMEMNSNTLIF